MEEKYLALQGGVRPWWDVSEQRLVKAAILYLPHGCPDWGEAKGERNSLCTFCSLPYAASGYRMSFYGTKEQLQQSEYLNLFSENFKAIAPPEAGIHTLMIFNAGSFLAEIANASDTQKDMVRLVADHPTVERLVIESRAGLIKSESLQRLIDFLGPAGKKLMIRVGIETQNDKLRMKVLKKGHSRRELSMAMETMKRFGVNSGGYVLLNSAPLNAMKDAMSDSNASEGDVYQWAMNETQATLEWVLDGNQLGMDEAYFCSTNVGPGTLLTRAWQDGTFRPASLWMVLKVLRRALEKYSGRVHLLPFKDEPELLAVPSNHVLGGIPQDLSMSQGCDAEFHAMLSRYRETMDPSVLYEPNCSCRPDWI